jgi:hypothetical protein
MNKLAAVEAQSDPQQTESGLTADRMVARVRLLMIISGLTTLIALAAVASVIGYRVFRTGGAAPTVTTDGIITLPKGARVIASSLADDRLAVTIDIGGATEIRTYDLKTLKETGRIRFATAP